MTNVLRKYNTTTTLDPPTSRGSSPNCVRRHYSKDCCKHNASTTGAASTQCINYRSSFNTMLLQSNGSICSCKHSHTRNEPYAFVFGKQPANLFAEWIDQVHAEHSTDLTHNTLSPCFEKTRKTCTI